MACGTSDWTAVGGCRRLVRTRSSTSFARAACHGYLACMFFLGCWSLSFSRAIRPLGLYCPSDPAAGQLVFKSVDSENSVCTPSPRDDVGQSVYECLRQFKIEVNGCQVSMRTDEAQLVGPGRLPCRLFSMTGNLTGEGVEAQMWADVDGPGLLSYYFADVEAVAALRYTSPHQLVRDIWAFLRDFTGDLRFADDSWIEQWWNQQDQDQQILDLDLGRGDADRLRRQLVADSERSAAPRSQRRDRHGAMRVYRTSETRVVVKVPTGCKYRYTVNPNSHVFESPARQHAHVQWRTIGLTVATLSVILSVVGLSACTYFSHRHAEYVSSYWEYQAVKDQLGSELPPATYQRLFGEVPKSAAAAAEATEAARRAAETARGRPSSGAASGASAAVAVMVQSPAGPQQHAPDALQAAAIEATQSGGGEPDGVGSRGSGNSSPAGGEVAAAGVSVVPELVDLPPVLVASPSAAAAAVAAK